MGERDVRPSHDGKVKPSSAAPGGYHSGVRSLVLVLMIVLLPIRVWAAEGMAIDMAALPAAMADMPEDCPMRAAAQPDEPAESPSSAPAACLACTLCAAVAVQPDFRAAAGAAGALPAVALVSSFDSADPWRELKPPIS